MMPALLPHLRFARSFFCARSWRNAAAPWLLGLAVLGLPTLSSAQESAPAQTSPTVSTTAAATIGEVAAPTAEQIRAVVASLDDDAFRTRQFALTRLNGWVALPAAQAPLAEVLRAVLLDPQTSFEVRTVCEPLLVQLPPAPAKAATPIQAVEIDRLIALCDADSFSVRVGSAARLAWLSKRDARFAYEVANKLKARLADPGLSQEMRDRLSSVSETARGVWLASEPAGWPRLDVSDAQIEAWVVAVGKTAVDKASRLAIEHAERELFDLLAHDDQVARVRVAIEKQIPIEAAKADAPMPLTLRIPQDFAEQQAEFEAADRLERLHEWTKPAMVAEVWINQVHRFVQYLQIGVPQYPDNRELNPRATHFDRIDDKTAHCVSGNSLAPGEYPVGIALPPNHPLHDRRDGVMFHLINLSTPRLRLIYENYHLKLSEEQRLAELTERTTAWMLAQKRTLADREILMMTQLDPVGVSRFVGPYLAAAEDLPRIEQPDGYPLDGRNSRHALLCLMLSEIGTHECLPGLAEAIRRGRIPGPTDRAAYHVGWLTAFSIADRDPWPGLDDWLASLIERDDRLHMSRVASPDVGATAAAMLLVRHGASISEFGLIEYTDAQLPGVNFPLCRFNAPERRGQVLQWWKQRRPKNPAA